MFLTFLYSATLALFSLGQLGRVSFLGQQINIYLYEVFMFTLLLFLVYKQKLKPLKNLVSKTKIVAIFFGYLFLSFFVSLGKFGNIADFVGILYLGRLIFYFLFFVYVFNYSSNLITRRLLIFIFLVIGLESLAQYFLYPDLRNLYYSGWDPHFYRIFGLFFDPPISAGIYGLTAIFCSLEFLKKHEKVWLFLTAGFSLLLLMTYSRGAYLAFFLTSLLLLYKKKMLKLMIGLVLISLLFLYILPKPYGESVNLFRLFSIESRLEDYANGLKMIEKYPIFGVGYNRIRYVKEKMGMISGQDFYDNHAGASFHSSFLIITASSGVIGLIIFISVLFKLSSYNLFSFLSIIFLSISSLTDNLLFHPFILFIFGVLFVSVIKLSQRSKSRL